MSRLCLAALTLALAAPAVADPACDARAVRAGEVMALRQAAAPAVALADLVRAAGGQGTDLARRALAEDASADPEAQELVAYHFAARIHAECMADAPMATLAGL